MSARPFVCPFTKKVRRDTMTRFFLRRIGFELVDGTYGDCQVPALVAPARLLPLLAQSGAISNDETPKETRTARAARVSTGLDVSAVYRRKVQSLFCKLIHSVPVHEASDDKKTKQFVSSVNDIVRQQCTALLQVRSDDGTVKTQRRDLPSPMKKRPAIIPASNTTVNDTDATPTKDVLTSDQCAALELCLANNNVYIGGNAGTGKSFLLVKIAEALTQKKKTVLITALTGVAALGIGGTTFHHAFGVQRDTNRITRGDTHKNPGLLTVGNELRNVDVIIVDEISMLNANLLVALDARARSVCSRNLPFGGIQVILAGDFLQLLPDTASVLDCSLFHNHFIHVALKQPMRQAKDLSFLNALNELRVGKLPDAIRHSASLNKACSNAVRLFPLRRSAKNFNTLMLQQLDTKAGSFSTKVMLRSVQGWSEAASFHLLTGKQSRSAQAALERHLRDALTKRFHFLADDLAFCAHGSSSNGINTMTVLLRARAWGKRLTSETSAKLRSAVEQVLAESGQSIRTSIAAPALLSSQKQSIINSVRRKILSDHLYGDKVLKVGCPVMLVKNLSDTLVNGSIGTIVDFVPARKDLLPTHTRVVFSCDLKKGTLFPLVKFDAVEAPVIIPHIVVCFPEASVEGFLECTVRVMPLVPAYAFTVHKVQGVTLDRPVLMDCERMWPCPHMVYVAASRVRKLEHLRILHLEPSHVSVDQKALTFSESLVNASDVATRLGMANVKKKDTVLVPPPTCNASPIE